MKRIALPLALFLALAALGRPARAEENPEFSARHILVSFQGAQGNLATRTKDEAKLAADKALAAVQAPGADFAAVSRQYSDDKASDAQGGFLGIFVRGTMTPKFQTAVEEMKEGEIRLVETPFGFHVVQRLSLAEGRKTLAENAAAVIGVAFPYKGAKGAQTPRSKELALEDAGRAAAHLRRGNEFEKLPKEWDGQSLRPGFMVLVVRRGQIRPEFKAIETNAFATKIGEVSDPFDTPAGYMVLKRVPWYRSHLQHFLVMHKGSERVPAGITRTKEEAKARADEAWKKLEADPASWGKVVAEYSDEPGAGERQGDLGTKEPGEFVPEFDAVVATLQVGGRTAVFESRFGWHVVRRTE